MKNTSLQARVTKAGQGIGEPRANRPGYCCHRRSGRSGPRNRRGSATAATAAAAGRAKKAGRCGQGCTASVVAAGGRRKTSSMRVVVRPDQFAARSARTHLSFIGWLRARLRRGLVDIFTTVDEKNSTEERMDLILIILILFLLFGGGLGYSPVGIWWRHRYRRYSADRARRLFVVRSRKILIFLPCWLEWFQFNSSCPDRVSRVLRRQ